MESVLKFMKSQMKDFGIDYKFLEWNDTLKFPYFIGEIDELENPNEDMKSSYQFILTGTDRGSSVTKLLAVAKKLKDKYKNGYTAILDNGSGIAISYSNSFLIPQDNEDLKRIQINLRINLWEI